MVDICRPPLQWIDGRCYRRQAEVEYAVEAGYTGEDGEHAYLEEHEEEMEHEIIELSGGRYRAVMQIASPFFPQIIGKGGESKRRLENETKTRINVPGKGKEGDVIIEGRERRGVAGAASRLDVLVASNRSKMPFTHFISIPLNTTHLQEAFCTFKEEVLNNSGSVRGLDSSIFQNPSMLHLTIGTMALLDDRERQLARELLEDCRDQVLKPIIGEDENLSFDLSGLEYMNDDPAEVDVLYCGVKDERGRLQEVADMIVDRFVASGLMRREYDRVKLHCTLLNTRFRREEDDLGKVKENEMTRESFDARPLLQRWGDLNLGKVLLSEIHLSQRMAGKKSAQGYYLSSAVLRHK